MEEFLKYSKISDEILWLGYNIISRFNVSLVKKDKETGDKRFFYSEFEYEGRFKEPSITIKRQFDYYISLESTVGAFNEKAFVRIGLKEFPLFKRFLKKILEWFTEKEFEYLFAISRKKLVLVSPIPKERIDLPFGQWIEATPTVIDYVDHQESGITLTISNDTNTQASNLNMDTITSYWEILSTMNMFNTAQIMVAAIPVPPSTNRHRMDDGTASSYHTQIQESVTNIPNIPVKAKIEGRFIGKRDTLDDL